MHYGVWLVGSNPLSVTKPRKATVKAGPATANSMYRLEAKVYMVSKFESWNKHIEAGAFLKQIICQNRI